MNYNSISGSIPTEFFSMTKLGAETGYDDLGQAYEALRLDYNSISKTLPTEIGQLVNFYNYNNEYFGYGTASAALYPFFQCLHSPCSLYSCITPQRFEPPRH